jgi:hypothetical protein
LGIIDEARPTVFADFRELAAGTPYIFKIIILKQLLGAISATSRATQQHPEQACPANRSFEITSLKATK